MTKVKAYAIHTVHVPGKDNAIVVVPASEKGKPSVFEIDSESFAKIEKLGAVRKATADEIAVAKAQADAANGVAPGDASGDDATDTVAETSTDTATSGGENSAGDAKAPASGAKHDPATAPKGKAKKDDDI